ncbi:MAG: hypothetical protein QOD28_1122 [Acidobacteriota bacterium]|nr:hypothetical protein [Acidobacteriota bacterium]
MMNEANFPKTLQEAIIYFSDPDTCTTFMAQLRWPDGVACPICNGKAVSYLSTRRMWKCKNKECFKQFSVKVGTVMEDSPIKLDKWLAAIWMIANCKNGVSSYEIHRALGITQKSAWFLNHRIRLAMQTGTFEKLSGQVEVDETYIGGLSRNMHRDKRSKLGGTGGSGKVAVMGLLERNGKVRAKVIGNNKRETLHSEVRAHVEHGAELFTDAWVSYNGLDTDYIHQVINHAEKYVDGKIHTNGIENFWSLLKRGIKGTYVSVEPFHLFRYLDEQSFRFNERKGTDSERFLTVISLLQGKRLEYKQLTGQPSC